MLLVSAQAPLLIADITRRARLPRSTVLLTLQKLDTRGLLIKGREGKRTTYRAQSPEHLLAAQEQTVQDLRDLVPLLQRLTTPDVKSDVKLFNGDDLAPRLYREYLLHFENLPKDPTREQLHIAAGQDQRRAFPEATRHYIQHRVKMGVFCRIIAPDTTRGLPTYDDDPKFLRACRYFDSKKYPYNGVFDICGDLVAMFSIQKPPFAVMIRDKRLAASMRSLFNLMWDFLPAES